MQIYYCEFSRRDVFGCTNEWKLTAMAGGKPVLQCDTEDFHGQRLSPEWVGEYPVQRTDTTNFDIRRYDLARPVSQH